MTIYRRDTLLRGGDDIDWSIWLVSDDKPYSAFAHYIHVQFGSIGVDKQKADMIVSRIINGLSAEPGVKK